MSPEIIVAIVTGIFGGGGIVGAVIAGINYLGNRPEILAKARRENVSAEIDVGKAWREFADSINNDYKKLKEQLEEMQKMYEEAKKKHEEAMELKTKEITMLKAKIEELQDELETLRAIPRGQ